MAFAQHRNVHVNSNGVEALGIQVIPYDSPGFRDELAKAVTASATGPEDEDFYPFCYILRNGTNKHVALYSTGITIMGALDKPVAGTYTWRNLQTFRGGDAIAPGASRLVSPVYRLGSAKNDILKKLQAQEQRSEGVTISVEAILFDDGTFVGPDTRGMVESARGYLDAERELLTKIIQCGGGRASGNTRVSRT